jgi:predicted RecA/RadA family phage recombinase
MAQTAEALFHKGSQETMPYVPGSAVDAGDLVFFGSGINRLVSVANAAIAASADGSVAYTGQYKVKKKASSTFAQGVMVGWDVGVGEAVIASSVDLDIELGTCVETAASADDYVVVAINQARGWETSGL